MERRIRSQHNEEQLLPFSGLGIPLSCVYARAKLSRLVPITTKTESIQRPLQPDFVPVYNGYGSRVRLLIALGRETRGR